MGDLESQFDDEQRRLVEAEKSQRRTTRRIKELTFSQEEDHKNHQRMQDLVDKLQNKVKRLLHLIWPSLERFRLTWSLLRRELISTNRSWPSSKQGPEAHLWDLFKRLICNIDCSLNTAVCQVSTYLMTFCSLVPVV